MCQPFCTQKYIGQLIFQVACEAGAFTLLTHESSHGNRGSNLSKVITELTRPKATRSSDLLREAELDFYVKSHNV